MILIQLKYIPDTNSIEDNYMKKDIFTEEKFMKIYNDGFPDLKLSFNEIKKIEATAYILYNDRDDIIGSFFLHSLTSYTMFLSGLCVLTSYRRNGIGSLLVKYSKKIAQKFKIDNVLLDSELNDTVIKFYRDKCGCIELKRNINNILWSI